MDGKKIEELYLKARSGSEEEKKKAIFLLAKSNSPRVIPYLEDLAKNDSDLDVRFYAKKAIFYLRKKFAQLKEKVSPDNLIANKDSDGIKTRIKLSLHHHDPKVRKQALLVAIQNKDSSILNSIINVLDTETDPEVKTLMLKTIAVFGNSQNIENIIKYLDDPDPRVRANAVEAIEFLGNKSLFPTLLKKLSDPDNRVRANAIKALRHFGGTFVLNALKEMAISSKISMRVSAAYALRFFNTPQIIPILKHLLVDVENPVRLKAEESLKMLAEYGLEEAKKLLNLFGGKDSVSVEKLEDVFSQENRQKIEELKEKYLSSSDEKEKLQLIQQLREENIPGILELFLELLEKEENEKLIASLVISIGGYKSDLIVKKIIPFLEHPNDRIRANAVEALGNLDSLEIYPLIAMFLEDKNNRVRGNAILALKNYIYFNPRKYLIKMIEENDELMALSAIYVISEYGDENLLDLIKHPYLYLSERTSKKVLEVLKIMANSNECPKAKDLYREIKETLDSGKIPGTEIYEEMIEINYGKVKVIEAKQEILPDLDSKLVSVLNFLDEINEKKEEYQKKNSVEEKLEFLRNLHEINEVNYNILQYAKEIEDSPQILDYVNLVLEEQYKDKNFRYILKMDSIMDKGTLIKKLDSRNNIESAKVKLEENIVELNRDLMKRQKEARKNKKWEGLFKGDKQLEVLNSLRLDTQKIIQNILLEGEKIKNFFWLYKDKIDDLYLSGRISLDSVTAEKSFNLTWLKREINMESTEGRLIFLDRMPRYMIVFLTNKRLILFLRGSTIASVGYYHAFWLDNISNIQKMTRGDYSILRFSVGEGKTEAIGGLNEADCQILYQVISHNNSKDRSIQEQLEELRISFENGEIDENEFYRRQAELSKKLVN